MPKYAYICPNGHTFDELFLSFSAVRTAEASGVICPTCNLTSERDTNPTRSMDGSGFSKYGVYTYE